MIYQVYSQFFLLILFLVVILTEACDIEVRLKSETEKPFQFHLSVESANYWSDRVIVKGKTIKHSDGSFSNYHVFHVSSPFFASCQLLCRYDELGEKYIKIAIKLILIIMIINCAWLIIPDLKENIDYK